LIHRSGGDGESTGHRMGRNITTLLGTKAADLDDADLQKMRYSLMNWGHDPLK
jgi:hypothetical protein